MRVEIVPILPGELLIGYRGRIASLNNCMRLQELRHKLALRFPNPVAGEQVALFDCLARAVSKDPERLLREHTLWPIFSAFTDDAHSHRTISMLKHGDLSRVWPRLARRTLAMCPDCVAGDLASIYLSYWRRSHQVPGLFHCKMHGSEMRFVVPGSFFTERPDEVAPRSRAGHPNAVLAARANPIAILATSVLLGLLEFGVRAKTAAILDSLRKKALMKTETNVPAHAVAALSQRVQSELSVEWLTDFMPNSKLTDRSSLSFLATVLNPSASAPAAAAVALSAALVVDSEDEAFAMLKIRRNKKA